MGRYCKVHRGPERVQVLEVNVPLIDVEIGNIDYLVFISESIAVIRVKNSIGPKCLGTWVIDVTQHGNVGLGDDVTNGSFSYSVSVLVSSRV